MSTDAIGAPQADAPTTELVTAVGDRCANCQAPLAADQRYCLNCGARRGRARFSAESFTAPASSTVVEHTVTPPPPGRGSSATTWVAGIATLLVAMGVGVLIGHNGNSSSGRTPAAQVITVGGGAGSASTSPSSTAGSSTSAGSTHKGPGKAVKPTVVHVTAKSLKASDAAASKVLGSSNNLSKNVQQKVGGSCSGGAGCQNGTFTGNYFPSG